ncbi:S8 family serine peptidase [bacterium]|nr:S8 family serine peptidase [bacterium]
MLNRSLIMFLLAIVGPVTVFAQAPQPRRVIVKFKSATLQKLSEPTSSALRKEMALSRVASLHVMNGEIWELQDSTVSISNVVARLRDQDWIEYAELDEWIPFPKIIQEESVSAADALASDPLFNDLWSMNNTGQSGGKSDADIDAVEAWNFQTGKRIKIGVIDTGIDWNHEDLKENIWINPGEDIDHDGKLTSNDQNGIDDDGNGFIDDIVGWDFVNNDNQPYDDIGHGTHVAGTIAAVANNGKGVAGIAWSAQLIALKFLGKRGGRVSDAVQAIDYATMMGAKITNNSWGGSGYSRALYDAIEAANHAGCLFMAAAGNDGWDNAVFSQFPANYALDNIISVAATNRQDVLAGFSNYGKTIVDLAAPGDEIISTVPNNKYAKYSGTSMATPLVTGAAALLWSENPQLPHWRIKEILLETADKLNSLESKVVTGARLNVLQALLETHTSVIVDPDTISFPVILTGLTSEKAIRIKNYTDQTKTITASSNSAAFQLSEMSFQLAPHTAVDISLTFSSVVADNFESTVVIKENDITIKSVVTAATAVNNLPTVGYSKDVFQKQMLSQSTVYDTLKLNNLGNSDLNWNITSPMPSWLSIMPMSGTIPSGQTTEVVLEFSSNSLKVFDEHFTNIDFATNDPNLVLLRIGAYVNVEQFTRVTTGSIVTGGGNSYSSNWIDYNNDGFQDLHVVNYGENDFLYKNNGDGTFTSITNSGITQDGGAGSYSASWADYDNDGYVDAMVVNADENGNNALYRNNQNGTFTKITGQIDHGAAKQYSVAGAWGDFNNDGFADLFVANEGFIVNRYGKQNFLYYNQNGIFTRSTQPLIANDTTWENSVSLVDYDNDGDTDVLTTNWPYPNILYTQTSANQFTRMFLGQGIPNDYWSSNWADYDNDGDLDVFMTGLSQVSLNPNKLFRNDGNGMFTELVDAEMAKHRAYFSIGSTSGDFDNDGDIDIYVANTKDFVGGPDPGFFFVNEGGMQFKRIESSVITSEMIVGHGCSFVDVDRDGDLDLFVAAGTDDHNDPDNPISNNNLLFLNNGNAYHWMSVRAVGETANRSGVGAHIRVKATINGHSVWQLREVQSLTGYASQDGFEIHFGLGDATTVDSLVIDWPNTNHTRTVYTNLAVDKFYTAKENGQILSKSPRTKIPEVFSLEQNYPNPFNPTTSIHYELSQKAKVTLKIYNVFGQEVKTLIAGKDHVAGRYDVEWNGRNDQGNQVASGIYFYRLQAGSLNKVMKMTFIK